MLPFLTSWLNEIWFMTLEAAPWLLGGFVLAGVIYVLVPVEILTRHVGRPGAGSVVKASLIGIPLPLCSCSVIPVASSFRKQGASRGAFVSFLISTPETGVDSIAISYALLGPVLAVVRPIAAFVTALTAGLLVDRAAEPSPSDADAVDVPQGDSCCSGESAEEADPAPPSKIASILRYGLVDLFKDLSPYLIGGFVLAGLVAAALPPEFLERHVGAGPGAMFLMLAVGLPLYVCATSSTPVAAALIAHGLSPGAALVFLLVGPATNIATMLIVNRDVGRSGLAIYLGTIAVFAVLFGLAIDFLLQSVPLAQSGLPTCGAHHASTWTWLPGLALIFLTFNGVRLRLGWTWPTNGKAGRQIPQRT